MVAHHLAKVRVASSNLVIRSSGNVPVSAGIFHARWRGREARQRPAKPCTPVRIRSSPRNTPSRKTQAKPQPRAVGAAVARFPDTEEVAGSIPVPPTKGKPRSSGVFSCPDSPQRGVGCPADVVATRGVSRSVRGSASVRVLRKRRTSRPNLAYRARKRANEPDVLRFRHDAMRYLRASIARPASTASLCHRRKRRRFAR